MLLRSSRHWSQHQDNFPESSCFHGEVVDRGGSGVRGDNNHPRTSGSPVQTFQEMPRTPQPRGQTKRPLQEENKCPEHAQQKGQGIETITKWCACKKRLSLRIVHDTS